MRTRITIVTMALALALASGPAAAQGPVWPHEGWTIGSAITDERKRAQREAQSDGISGYLAATVDG